jgi:uncharacterized SAM-dependent methyltransferase
MTFPGKVDQRFLDDTLALFAGTRHGHMGLHQYAAHHGMRGTTRMSGADLWRRFATEVDGYYIPAADRALLLDNLEDISDQIPIGTPFVDLGPGSMTAIREKSLPLLRAIGAKDYCPIDMSQAFLDDAEAALTPYGLRVSPRQEDFFAPTEQTGLEDPSLAYFSSSNISNLTGPISKTAPTDQLTKALSKLAHRSHDGWLLISFDSNQDGAWLQRMYGAPVHRLFGANVFHRMAEELPMQDFDPSEFIYHPVWNAPAGQLAHTVSATKSQNFSLAGQRFQIRCGDRLHLNNSYKYPESLFEQCATRAGLHVWSRWQQDTPMRLYLLSVQPRQNVQHTVPYRAVAWG